MIKKLMKVGVILTGFVALPSWAYMITDSDSANNGDNVGGLDALLEIRTGVSGDAAELAFINDYATPDYVFTISDLKLDPVAYYDTDGDNVFAFGPADLGDYFIVKNGTYYALFENNALDNYGVFNANLFPDAMNIPSDDYEISHVSRTPTTTTTVPEPAMVGLLAIGLIGMIAVRRKKTV